MAEQPLVSIIIPTYNRAHLIEETLDSVLAQTYTNWECIVVDDGSTDATDELMAKYCAKDSRIRYYHRPDEYLPGGNGARNYGFKMSKGEYIQWFDSDDLMVENKIALKVEAFQKNEVDFVISQTKYFNNAKKKVYEYNYHDSEVNFLSYATTNISWFTPDIFLKRIFAEKVSFNERLKSGQEYNFSCKLLLLSPKLKKINKVLTLRRDHINSIGKKRQLNPAHYAKTNYITHWQNLQELERCSNLNTLPMGFYKYALYKCMRSYLDYPNSVQLESKFLLKLMQIYGFKSIYFFLAMFSVRIFGKKEFFLEQIKK